MLLFHVMILMSSLSQTVFFPSLQWHMHLLICVHKHTLHTHTHDCAHSKLLRELPQGIEWKWMSIKQEVSRKKEGGEKPMWQREILIFTEISWSLPPSLPPWTVIAHSSLSPSISLHINLSSASLFLLHHRTFISFPPTSFLFLSPPPSPSLHSPCLPLSSLLLLLPLFRSLSLLAFTLSYYGSLCIPPPSSSLCHSGRAAGRQKQHILMLLYLKRHTHTFSCHMHDCTNIRKRRRGGGGTHSHIPTRKIALKCTCD